jgi:lipoate-protein ligase A
MTARWRLLDLPPMTAAENMALDEVLLEIRGQGRSTDTLRSLQFRPAAALVGFHQSVQEEIRLDYCRAQGIEVNRRITGGGGLLLTRARSAGGHLRQGIFRGAHPTRPCSGHVRTNGDGLRAMGLDAAFRPPTTLR